jgi:ATP-dependent Clp protease ATP-binding subunit ClpA
MRDSGSSVGKVFGRFSGPAHRVLDLAREEAGRCSHRYLGPEHVLLGMLAEGQSRAAGVLRAAGVDLVAARAALARLAERGVAKHAVQLASAQARALGHGQVSPEHLLLGVLEDARQPADTTRGSRRHRQIIAHVGLPNGYRGGAGLLLATLGVDLDRLRDAVAIELGGIRR